jgi:RNA polymerase sigma factor (sigma-70 family)
MADVALAEVVQELRRLATSPQVKERTDQDLLGEFQARRDQTAFAALVERHGPLVLRVCRQVLRHQQDAEDAFQATFLVLARRAGAIRKREALAAWLHGVAYRIAMHAKRSAARLRAHEARAAAPSRRSGPDDTWRETQAVLHDEIERLPAIYRTPFVLCFLEGHGRAEAARQLGLKEGTLWSRLATARQRLRTRLARRGIELGAVLAAAQIADAGVPTVVPAAIAAATVRAAAAWAAGAGNTAVSPAVAALAHTSLKSITALKTKIGLTLFLLACLIGAGTGALVASAPPAQPESERPTHDKVAGKSVSAAQEEKKERGDRYGDPLPQGAIARLGTLRFRQGTAVYITQFSPDGKNLLLGGRTLALWDTATGRKIRDFPVSPIRAALSPDGKQVAVGEIGTSLWDVATGQRLQTLDKSFAASLAFLDDTLLAVGGEQGVTLWDLPSGKKIRHLSHGATVRTVVFPRGGKTVASAGEDGTVRLWDLASGKELRRWETTKSVGHELAASSTSPWLALAEENLLRLLDADSGKEVRLLGPNPYQRGCVAFSPDGKTLASAQDLGTIYLWDPSTGKEIRRWKAAVGMFHSLTFTPDGKTLVSSCRDGVGVRWWDVATGKEIHKPWIGHHAWVKAVGFSKGGQELFSLGADGGFLSWKLADATHHRHLQLPSSLGAMFSPDGKNTLSIDWDGKEESGYSMSLRDTATGKNLRSLGKVPYANLVAFSPDGKNVALTEADDGNLGVSVWDFETGKLRHRFTRPGNRVYFCLAFSPDGKRVAAGSWDAAMPNFRLWDLQSGKEIPSCNPDHWVNSITFSADGTLVALGSGGDPKQCVSVWKLATATEIQRFSVPGSEAVSAFSPSGRFLATGSSSLHMANTPTAEEKIVRVWEIATGKQVASFEGHHGAITALSYAPDGKSLASGSVDSTILIWDLVGRLRKPKDAQPLTAGQLEALWNHLLDADAAKAFRAIGDLVVAGDEAALYLKKQLSPVPIPDAALTERATQLVADLDSDKFAVRQKAMVELDKMGDAAAGALRKALAAPLSLETRRRIEQILTGLDGKQGALHLRKSRALEALELIATSAARDVLQALAAGDPGARLTQEASAAQRRLERRQEPRKE